MKTTPEHQSLETLTETETDTQEHVYQKPVRYGAEMTSDWNVISMQHSFTDRATDQWQDYFNTCLEAKIKHSEYLLWRVSP